MITLDMLRFVAVALLLAGLDILGTVCLKEAALRRSPELAMAGVAVFVALAGALYVALDVAEMTLVSLGWIVILQVAVMVVDHRWYGVTPGRLQLAAIVVAFVALIVACLAPSATPTTDTPTDAQRRIPEQRASPTLEERLRTGSRPEPPPGNGFFDIRE